MNSSNYPTQTNHASKYLISFLLVLAVVYIFFKTGATLGSMLFGS